MMALTRNRPRYGFAIRRATPLALALAALSFVAGLALLPAARAAPLPARVTTLPLGGYQAASAGTPFTMVGVSWSGADIPTARLRTSVDGIDWTEWTSLEGEPEDAPDPGTSEASGRRALGPVWTGPARYVEVAIDGAIEEGRLHLVDTKGTTAPLRQRVMAAVRGVVRPPAAGAITVAPDIVSRAEWGADESLRRPFVGYGRRVQVAVVHHTVGSNTYTPSESAEIVRGMYAFHVQANGWSDIGYNLLVDRYGTVFEGRWGGIDRSVIGAHAEGFNSRSTGIALMGTFSTDAPPAAMTAALTRVLAWKLDVHHVEPTGTSDVVSAGNAQHPSGSIVTLRNVSGHRDTVATSCPGQEVYARIPAMAAQASAMGLPKIHGGDYRPTPAVMAPDGEWPPITFSATFTSDTIWSLTIHDPTGPALDSFSGEGTELTAIWEAVDGDGAPLPPGDYVYVIEAEDDFRPVREVLKLGASASFDTYYLVGNPGSEDADVRFELTTPAGETTIHDLAVPAGSRRTVYLNDVIPGVEVAAHLTATVPVVAERAMYFEYRDDIAGGSNAVGATAPATTWHFAEGYTAPGFEQYLTILNPAANTTVATIEYMFPGGATKERDLTLTANSRTTVFVNQDVGRDREVSTRVTATRPIVVERPMYYETDRWKGGDVVMGVNAPSPTWYFAEGYTGEGFDEYLTIQNPGSLPAPYTVTFMDASGETTAISRTVAAQARDTVDVRAEVGDGKEVSARVASAVPLVAERPMYFTYKGDIRDGHNSVGLAQPARRFLFAEGYTGPSFDEYLTIQNPGPIEAEVTVRYLLASGPPIVTEHRVAPESRYTISVADEVGRDQDVSAELESSVPVVAERPMYFWYYDVWDGGHVASGVEQAAPEWYFAEGYTG